MSNDLSQSLYVEDEIDLREIIKILIESKKLLFSTMLVFTIAGFLYSLSLKPSFETSTILEVGYFETDGVKEMIESPPSLLTNLNILKLKKYPETPESEYKLSFKLIEERLIKLKAESSSIEKNKKMLNDMTSYALERHSKFLEINTKNKIQITKLNINLFQSEIASRNKLIQDNADSDLQDKNFLSNEVFKLNRELTALKNTLNKLKTRDKIKTQTIGDFQTKTEEPKIALILILSSIIGFITGVFLVLIKNFVKSYKEIQA